MAHLIFVFEDPLKIIKLLLLKSKKKKIITHREN